MSDDINSILGISPDSDPSPPPAQSVSGPLRRRVRRVFLLLALAVPLLTAILNPSADRGEIVFRDAQHMEQLGGSFGWRYFKWHTFGRNDQMTDFEWWLHDHFDADLGTAAQIRALVDVTNPTLFHFTLLLLMLAWLGPKLVAEPPPKPDCTSSKK